MSFIHGLSGRDSTCGAADNAEGAIGAGRGRAGSAAPSAGSTPVFAKGLGRRGIAAADTIGGRTSSAVTVVAVSVFPIVVGKALGMDLAIGRALTAGAFSTTSPAGSIAAALSLSAEPVNNRGPTKRFLTSFGSPSRNVSRRTVSTPIGSTPIGSAHRASPPSNPAAPSASVAAAFQRRAAFPRRFVDDSIPVPLLNSSDRLEESER
jgi:hypothetical protein